MVENIGKHLGVLMDEIEFLKNRVVEQWGADSREFRVFMDMLTVINASQRLTRSAVRLMNEINRLYEWET